MENQDFLFNDIDVKKYKMSEADIIPYYLYFNLYKNCLAKDIRHRHYKVNNDFVRKYVLSSGAGVSESLWCSPSSFNDSGVLLIGDMPVADGDPNGTVTVRLLDSSEEQYFYICDADIMYAVYLVGEALLLNTVIYEFVYNINGTEKIAFSMFYTKNKHALISASALQGCVKFGDCDCILSYKVVSPYEYFLFTSGNYAATFFKNKRMLGDFVCTLAEYITPTEGLKILDKRSVELFNQMYNGDDPLTLSERKLFFREMSASSGALSYTQCGSNFLLSKLKEICVKLGIKYWLYYGTLLGAKRHGAFIPWDDDIDVGLMRADIYRLASYLKDDNYFSVDVLYNTEWADRVYKFRFKGDYLPVYVDLFPFDYCRGDSAEIWHNLKKIKGEMVRTFREYEERTGNRFRKTFYIPQQQMKEVDALFEDFGQKSKKLLGIVECKTEKIVYGYDSVFLSDWLQVFDLKEVQPFENIKFNGEEHPAFKNSDEVLVKNYTAPYTLPNDIVSHRHTDRMSPASIARLEELMNKLKNYKF